MLLCAIVSLTYTTLWYWVGGFGESTYL